MRKPREASQPAASPTARKRACRRAGWRVDTQKKGFGSFVGFVEIENKLNNNDKTIINDEETHNNNNHPPRSEPLHLC